MRPGPRGDGIELHADEVVGHADAVGLLVDPPDPTGDAEGHHRSVTEEEDLQPRPSAHRDRADQEDSPEAQVPHGDAAADGNRGSEAAKPDDLGPTTPDDSTREPAPFSHEAVSSPG